MSEAQPQMDAHRRTFSLSRAAARDPTPSPVEWSAFEETFKALVTLRKPFWVTVDEFGTVKILEGEHD